MPARSIAAPASTPKRDHLLATAYRLFYRDGYHAVGIDTILAEARLAKMTLYHHFASKDELIVAVLDGRSAQVRVKVEELLARAGPSPCKRLLAYFKRYEKWFAGADFKGCAFIRAVAECPEINSAVHQVVIRHKRRGIDELRSLLAAMEVFDPDKLAPQLAVLLEGAIVSAHTGDPTALVRARAAALALIKASARGH